MSGNLKLLSKLIREQLPSLSRQYKLQSLELFGSYVRGEAKKDSDLDILVEFKESPTLIKFIELENRLSDLLGVKVDLVMKKVLKPAIGRRILREAIPV